MKKLTLTEKCRKNPWMTATFFLIGIILFLIFFNIVRANIEVNSWKYDNKIIKEVFNSSGYICNSIEVTPSWTDYNGNIIGTGYFQVIYYDTENETLKEEYYKELRESLENYLIAERINFIYQTGCSYCEKQIAEFKKVGFWEEYVKEGLTIDCKESE